jgi:hypothetical protein
VQHTAFCAALAPDLGAGLLFVKDSLLVCLLYLPELSSITRSLVAKHRLKLILGHSGELT